MDRGDWMQTASGRKFYPLDPRPEEVNLFDIAYALSNICRFGGHCRPRYTVLEHSYRVAEFVPPRLRFAAMFHDAPEAYLGDMVQPVKHSGAMESYKEIERGVERAIFVQFKIGITPEDKKIIKAADNILLMTERRDLGLKVEDLPWFLDGKVEPLPDKIVPFTDADALSMFVEGYLRLIRDNPPEEEERLRNLWMVPLICVTFASLAEEGKETLAHLALAVVGSEMSTEEWNRYTTKAMEQFEVWSKDNPSGDLGRFLNDRLLALATAAKDGELKSVKAVVYWLALYSHYSQPVPASVRKLETDRAEEIKRLAKDFSWAKLCEAIRKG